MDFEKELNDVTFHHEGPGAQTYYPSRPGTNQPEKTLPHLWKTGPDPRTHFMHTIYRQAIAQANHRKEEWDFEFNDWKDTWDEKFDYRGRKATDYAMVRTDPSLPWGKDNVQIMTRSEMFKHASKVSSKAKTKVHTPLGTFDSLRAAARVHSLTVSQLKKLITTTPTEFYKEV